MRRIEISVQMFLFLFLKPKPTWWKLFSGENFWQIKSVGGTNQRPSLTEGCLQRIRGGGIFNIHTRLPLIFVADDIWGLIFQYRSNSNPKICVVRSAGTSVHQPLKPRIYLLLEFLITGSTSHGCFWNLTQFLF